MDFLPYLTPTTLEEMYKDLDGARLSLLNQPKENIIHDAAKYHELTEMVAKINDVYSAITGNELWAQLAENK